MPAPPTTRSELLEVIRLSAVLPAEKLTELVGDGSDLPEEAAPASVELIRRGVISKFQSALLLQGKYKGFRLGSYVIRELLGRGGMGAVYLAEHQELRRKVAIKVLVTAKDQDSKLATDRFLREARAAAALDHPNIVRIFDVARHGETPYLVMEYVDGENLQFKLDRDGAMNHAEAAEYVAQAAAGLQHAHEKGFVHRDIKPANIMKDSTGTIKILDMGLARSFEKSEDKLTEVMDKGAIVGTADFISPEQALNNPIDIRADIYSLGATFFALVTGRPPFDGNTTQKLLQHQLKTPPTLTSLNSRLPAGLSVVIGKMLAKKPEQRYSVPADVIAALNPWLPSSHRVLAGLSRTKLAESADIQVALQQEAGHGGSSSLRLSTVAIGESDTNTRDPHDATTDTVDGLRAVHTARTSLSKLHRKTPKPSRGFRKSPLLIASGAALAVALGVYFAVLTHGKPAPTAAVEGEQAALKPSPTPQAAPPELATPPAAVLEPKMLYSFSAASIKPFKFSMTGPKLTAGERPELPDGLTLFVSQSKSESDFALEMVDGAPAIAITNQVTPAAGTIIFEMARLVPGFRCTPGRTYRVSLDYRSDGTARPSGSVQTLAGKPIQTPISFTATKGEWKTAQFTFRAGGDALRIAIENKTLGLENLVYLRTLDVVELPVDESTANDEPQALLTLDLKDMKAFSQLAEVSSAEGAMKTSRSVLKSGEGKVPTGWTGKAVGVGTQIEYLYDEEKAAMGLRNIGGPGGASLSSPPFNTATGVCRVRFEYHSAAAPGLARLRVRPLEGGMREVLPLEPTEGNWKTFDGIVPMLSSSAGALEFYNADPRADGVVYFRGLTVLEAPASAAPSRVEGEKVYAFDLSGTPNFRNKKEGQKRIDGPVERLPKGVRAYSSKTNGLVEFACEVMEGAPVLVMINGGSEPAATVSFDLEGSGGAVLEPGKDYRIRMVYMPRKAAEGSVSVSGVESSTTPIITRRFGPGESKWTTVDLAYTRQESPSRITVTHRGPAGEENAIVVKSFEVFELK